MNLKILLYSFVFTSCFISSNVKFTEKDILSVDEAFILSSKIVKNKVSVSWNIKPGYYLYKKSILIKSDNDSLKHNYVSKNQSTISDEFFGDSIIFKDFLEIDANLLQLHPLERKDIKIIYQGCAEGKYCYPEVIKSL
ncbi:MAG: thiol:disulfide interchange protein [SAR86 cluster bacterium]|uniref:Thiol:disulfide interchange protein n=1 Tax=SAR86 cluster bacterium TaxID=2030880 RepID=A0A368BNP1_9GAMM|nr:thiol:disulfide interchange protein [Gammaproteobacteria bacterium]RCL38462.1 MAG: thiol:disulfide interchange protein [SAR86 cluster bacterium]